MPPEFPLIVSFLKLDGLSQNATLGPFKTKSCNNRKCKLLFFLLNLFLFSRSHCRRRRRRSSSLNDKAECSLKENEYTW